MSSVYRVLSLLALPLLMSACSGSDGDDLDQFMADAPKTMSTSVEPLPQVQPYVAIQFNLDGTIYDPFRPRKSAGKGSFQPNLDRPKEPLESFALENLKYVGALSKGKASFALIRTPDNTIQQARVGQYLGTNFGLITAISDTEVTLKEIIQDDLSGDWVERVSSLSLQE